MKNTVHLTSVHPRYDTRIFLKECRSLASAGYDVSLVVADGLTDEEKDGVKIYSLAKSKGRLKRILMTPSRVYKKAIELNGEIYHLHDPELIPIGLKLKKRGKKVIFDSHEDVSMQLLSKPYLNRYLRRVLSFIYSNYERFALKQFDVIVTATPFIRDKFKKWHPNVVDINNYPILGELIDVQNYNIKKNKIAYVGGISEIRGIRQMVKVLEFTKNLITLQLAGNFPEGQLRDEVAEYEGWSRVEEKGFVDRTEVKKILNTSVLGLLLILPENINIRNGLPIKMFEYMSAGIPVLASNFPFWKEIIDEYNCGIYVDPYNVQEIAIAIDWIIENPDKALQMGENGREAVKEKYNWGIEEKKLLNLYEKLLLKGGNNI